MNTPDNQQKQDEQTPEKGKEAPDPMKSDVGRPEKPKETAGESYKSGD